MRKDVKLDKLCQEFISLNTGEKEYIIGISKALAFSIRCIGERQGILPGSQNLSIPKQGGKAGEGKKINPLQ